MKLARIAHIAVASLSLAVAVVAGTSSTAQADPSGGGCNQYGCWHGCEGTCNQYGCSDHGGCNQYGCWQTPRGGCNQYGCWR